MSKTVLIIALASFLMTSCDFKKKEVYSTTEKEQTTSSEENSYEAQREGYKKGYDDRYGWMRHGVNYNSTTEKEQTTSSEENSYEAQREGYKKVMMMDTMMGMDGCSTV